MGEIDFNPSTLLLLIWSEGKMQGTRVIDYEEYIHKNFQICNR